MTSARKREKPRQFLLTVVPHDGTAYGLTISETNGTADNTHVVARLRPDQVERIAEPLLHALRVSGKPTSSLGPARRTPIQVTEAAGVRLALAATSVAPLTIRRRVRQVLGGVGTMSDEEAYYWYAKTTERTSGTRALRALRLLLSDDERPEV